MTFKAFLNLLPKLAFLAKRDNQLSLKEKLNSMIESNFEPLYHIIKDNTFLGSLEKMTKRNINFEEVEQIFKVIKFFHS